MDLAHSAIDVHSTSDRPGVGQQQVVRTLRDLGKLRLPEDEPDSPAYVRDRTPLKKGQIATRALRDEFRRDPALPIVGDDVFVRGLRRGIEQGEYVYRRGDLLFGPGDPPAEIAIDEQSVVFTMAYAKNKGVWPRPKPAPPASPAPPAPAFPPAPDGEGAGPSGGPPGEPPPPTPEPAGGTPVSQRDTPIPGRAASGNPASGSRQPGGGRFFVVLSKTSWARDFRGACPRARRLEK